MKNKNKKIILSTSVIILILVGWEAFVRIGKVPLYVLPSPTKIITTIFAEMENLVYHGGITLFETVVGFCIATVVGIVLAILMDHYETFRMAIYPILVVSQTVPVIVLAPILIIYMGFGMAPKILIVVLMCFFPIAVNFADGMAMADKGKINLLKSFGASKWQIYTLVKIPFGAKNLFSGMRVGATYSISGAVVGEWLSAERGLGYYMLRVKNAYMLDKVFASVVVVILLSLFMNGIVKFIQYACLKQDRKKKERN